MGLLLCFNSFSTHVRPSNPLIAVGYANYNMKKLNLSQRLRGKPADELVYKSICGMDSYVSSLGRDDTREACARYFNKKYPDVGATADNMVITVGATGGLSLIMNVWFEYLNNLRSLLNRVMLLHVSYHSFLLIVLKLVKLEEN